MDKLQLIGLVYFVFSVLLSLLLFHWKSHYANANNLNGIDAHIYVVVVQRTNTHTIDRRFSEEF